MTAGMALKNQFTGSGMSVASDAATKKHALVQLLAKFEAI